MIVLPNLNWYLGISTTQQLSPRCPYASVYRCSRFYQSLSLMGHAGNTKIDPKEDDKLKESWEKTDVWPITDEQATSVAGAGDETKHFSRFCPEVLFDRFGLFAVALHKYADEIDLDSAHKALAREGALPDDWRWNWCHIEPMHYTECSLYSLLKLGKGRNGPVEQILQKYEGQRVKADNDKQLEQYFIFKGKLHYVTVEAAQVCETHKLAPQPLAAEEEVILTEAPRGCSYNGLQMEDILHKLGITTSIKAESPVLELLNFKDHVERQAWQDVYVNGKPQENIARGFLQTFLAKRSYREVPVKGGKSDILVFTRGSRFLYETKIWRGTKYYRQGLREIAEYIQGENDDNQLKGVFFIIFDPTKTNRAGSQRTETIGSCEVNVIVIHISPPTPSKKKI